MDEAPVVRGFNTEALIAAMRSGDQEALGEAYRRTFGGPLGRLVLADHLKNCGIGAITGPGVAADDRHYQAGMHDAALGLANTAGYDQASAVVLALTDELEGRTLDHDGPSYGHEPGLGDELP